MPSPINRRGIGTIFKRCDHNDWDRCKCLWTIRFYDGLTASGKPKQSERTGPRNKTEAWNKLTEIKNNKLIAKGAKVKPKRDLLFSEYAEERISRKRISEKTKRNYRGYLRLHVNPNIGSRRLSMFNDDQILFDLVDRLEKSGLHPGYINTIIRFVVLSTLRVAKKQGLVPMDLDDLGDLLPEYIVRRRYCPTQAEIVTLAENIDPRLRFAIYLMAGCGARIGEAVAVDDGCFIADGLLRLTRQWQDTSKFKPLKYRKDGEYRDVPFADYLEEIRQWHIAQGYTRQGQYFPAWAGAHPVLSKYTVQRHINDTVKRCGLNPEMTAHTFRHAFATYAITGGSQIPEVAMWLGHRDINVTYRVYGHLVFPSFEKARNTMDSFLRAT